MNFTPKRCEAPDKIAVALDAAAEPNAGRERIRLLAWTRRAPWRYLTQSWSISTPSCGLYS